MSEKKKPFKKPRPPVNPPGMAAAASAFVTAFQRCQVERKLDAGGNEWPIIPAVVCAGFALELSLKSLVAFEGGEPWDHKLLPLFNNISPESRAYLATVLSLSEHDLRQKIGALNNPFESWRYFFESKDEMKIDITTLFQISEEVSKLANAKRLQSTKDYAGAVMVVRKDHLGMVLTRHASKT